MYTSVYFHAADLGRAAGAGGSGSPDAGFPELLDGFETFLGCGAVELELMTVYEGKYDAAAVDESGERVDSPELREVWSPSREEVAGAVRGAGTNAVSLMYHLATPWSGRFFDQVVAAGEPAGGFGPWGLTLILGPHSFAPGIEWTGEVRDPTDALFSVVVGGDGTPTDLAAATDAVRQTAAARELLAFAAREFGITLDCRVVPD